MSRADEESTQRGDGGIGEEKETPAQCSPAQTQLEEHMEGGEHQRYWWRVCKQYNKHTETTITALQHPLQCLQETDCFTFAVSHVANFVAFFFQQIPD